MDQETAVTGSVVFAGGVSTPTAGLPWTPHSTFAGVALKHLMTGKETQGRLSLHLVRIDPDCCIGDHLHEGKVEVHEVLKGEGAARVGDVDVPYSPGVLALIPADLPHRVVAGDPGLLLLATFAPALL